VPVLGYVGVTDWDWYRFLQARAATEVNFWQPSGGRRFGAIPADAPFLFKTHYSDGNRIVGAGFPVRVGFIADVANLGVLWRKQRLRN
jgi:putative restriction endonuclease